MELTAIHKHLQDETPRLWWVHYAGYGNPVAIAATLHAGFAVTGMPLSAPPETEAPIPLDTAALDPEYWYQSVRQTVRFDQAVRSASEAGYRVFIESSPHPVLIAGVEEILADRSYIDGVLARGAEQANELAHRVMKRVRNAIGL